MDGTATNIGYHNEKFQIKTGMLEDVFALAGFGVDGKGRNIAFAYIVNVPGGGVMNLERSGADVMKSLSELK
jgi:D-alanyl-D-alanine carboxypeptidase